MEKPKIAIIGAGLSGVSLATFLRPVAEVRLFEKSRGVSGRMSTRREGDLYFDHGAQFFTAKSQAFNTFLEPLIQNNIVQTWQPNLAYFDKNNLTTGPSWSTPHYVGCPGMNAICKTLIHQQVSQNAVSLNITIKQLKQRHNRWWLFDSAKAEYGPFDWVISTIPQPQLLALFDDAQIDQQQLINYHMSGCYSVMIGFQEPLHLSWQAAIIENSPIQWISVNSSKPMRQSPFCLVAQTSNDWAEQHIESDPGAVLSLLVDPLYEFIGRNIESASHCKIHKWRYANRRHRQKNTSPENTYWIDHTQRVAACGDWFSDGRVEAAFLSAWHLAKDLLPKLNQAI